MRVHLIPTLLLAAACGGDVPDPAGPENPGGPGTNEPSYYALQVSSYTLTGNSGVETSWQPDNRILYLGADKVAEPLGTVTLVLGEIQGGENGIRRANVVSATVSATRVRVGTGPELDGRLWTLSSIGGGASEVSGIRTGSNYIEGTLSIFLEQASPAPQNGEPPATAILSGTFRAKTK